METRVAEQVTQLERFSKLKHELSLAGEIQKSMLPRSIPRLEGYEFSMDMNDKEMFVTILFGILNRVTHQFHYARAGHEAPIFFDEQGSIKRMPKTNGQALGVFDEIALDEQTVELSKGSMLLLYSDGIPETPNRQNVSFGHDGLVRTVGRMRGFSAQAVCDELIKAVVKHQEGSLQHDDMTVVVVRAV